VSERPLRSGNWSVQELERLRQLLPRRGVVETALLLRRSEQCVHRKAGQLLRVPPRRGAWTPSDDGRLRESWGAVEPRLLGTMLGRSAADVRRRAAELSGELRSGPWSRAEVRLLKDLYGTRSDADLVVALQRPAADIAAMARGLCLAKDKRFAAQAAERAAMREMPRWTAAEVEKLRALYADRDNLTVARALDRSVASIANKANLLGLKKSPRTLARIGRANVGLRYAAQDGGEAG
jgi:hypothetical protein